MFIYLVRTAVQVNLTKYSFTEKLLTVLRHCRNNQCPFIIEQGEGRHEINIDKEPVCCITQVNGLAAMVST